MSHPRAGGSLNRPGQAPRLSRPDESLHIHQQTHHLWGGGLDRDAYVKYWRMLCELPWSRKHLETWVLPGTESKVLCSLKLYRLQFIVGGLPFRASILGSLFTPPALRGQGYATTLAEQVLSTIALEGDAFTMLFSDIGSDFYRPLGFRALPAWEVFGQLPNGECKPRVAPGWKVRPMEETDFELMESLYLTSTTYRALAIERDAEQWKYMRLRTHAFFQKLPQPASRARVLLAGKAGRPVGYMLITEAAGEWVIRELVAADQALRIEMWRAMLHFGVGEGLRRIYGWLDAELAGSFPAGACRRRRRSSALPMVAAHASRPDWDRLSAVGQDLLSYQDQF